MARERHLHTSHWGAFEADGAVVAVHPYRDDPDPSPLLDNIPASLRHRARIAQLMVRAGWLDRGPGPDGRRGAEPFVPVSWPTAVDLLGRELRRVYDQHGGEAVYGGSSRASARPLHMQENPPSMKMEAPVTKSDAGLARKTASPAKSSGTPQRFIGLRAITFSCMPGTSSRAFRMNSVSMYPGWKQFTWMLSFAHAVARHFVSCTIPPLAAL